MKFRGKMSKSVALLTALIFVLGVFAAGCGESKDTIKIGVNYELSGPVATYGTSCKNGIMLAFDEINKEGGVLGKQIEGLVQDNKSQNREARNVAEKLVSKGVVAIIGPATTGNVQAEEPFLTKSKIPLLATAATAPEVTYDEKTKKVRDYVFRVCIIDPDQSQVMSNYISDELQLKNGAIMVDKNNDYSVGLGKTFKEFFTDKGGKIVAEEGFVDTDTVFKPQLTSIAAKKPDFIYIPAYYNQVGMIIKQARELGIDLPIMGADGWDSPELVSLAGADNLAKCYFTNHYSVEDPSERIQNFVKAYEKKHGTAPDAFAALGYDAGYLMVEAIKQAGEANPQKIKDAMANIKDFEGVTGKLSFDEKHNPIKEVSIIEMMDGKQKLIKKMQPVH
ncbi:ABC transporter substrate-binding protein [Syntrophaceticus schinkii]|jgi:branched-chain amino acid transport system substrate-binding protein|uniref:Extracellular ligand-binding receptor n=1 Tax=Syntrophaceticus schinkii TaxID=499207 RepID=A0A0B7MGZ2_9FIRM|nr:ABC transporter substrate-binding protein [Syntrophaceticus schinkii]CEO87503.1 Extracellular ligand-binding receptor [Syntrophaceticus schinkii]